MEQQLIEMNQENLRKIPLEFRSQVLKEYHKWLRIIRKREKQYAINKHHRIMKKIEEMKYSHALKGGVS